MTLAAEAMLALAKVVVAAAVHTADKFALHVAAEGAVRVGKREIKGERQRAAGLPARDSLFACVPASRSWRMSLSFLWPLSDCAAVSRESRCRAEITLERRGEGGGGGEGEEDDGGRGRRRMRERGSRDSDRDRSRRDGCPGK